jgi:hypothetical protein
MTMNVLYSTHTSLNYMPPLTVSSRQITVGPNYHRHIEAGTVRSLHVAPGRYDLATLVASLPAGQKPELTIVLADAYQTCVPVSLAAVPGRKLLLVADTHHGVAPLQKMLAYARQEPFDRIVVTHDPHHLHWFTEADIAPTTYIPNVNCANFSQPLVERRQPAIIFVGQTGQWHHRRRHLLEAIQNAGLPLIVRQAPAPMAATMYNATQITFNCSLNGDLNMRIFEVMAAGGFLVTDRLSPQSGLETLFHRGKQYVDYDGVDDLLHLLRHYLAHPGECLRIARAGQKAYLQRHQPAQRARDLIDFGLGNSARSCKYDPRTSPKGEGFGENLLERIHLYELLQHVSLQNEQVFVLVDPALGARIISDLVDLPRLRIQLIEQAERHTPIRELLKELGVLRQIDLVKTRPSRCDIQLMHADTLSGLRDASSVYAQRLLVIAEGHPLDGQTAWLASHGFSKVAETPHSFQRTP